MTIRRPLKMAASGVAGAPGASLRHCMYRDQYNSTMLVGYDITCTGNFFRCNTFYNLWQLLRVRLLVVLEISCTKVDSSFGYHVMWMLSSDPSCMTSFEDHAQGLEIENIFEFEFEKETNLHGGPKNSL